MNNISVLIAEDEALVRQGILALIEDEVGDITECSDGDEALQLLKQKPFDIALLDIGLPRRTGIDILTEVRQRDIDIKVIILTGDTNSYAPTAIYEAGADAFLYKTAEADNFLEVFSAVANGRNLASQQSPEEGCNAGSVAELREKLTPRELQIIKLIVEGCSNREVAGSLFISEHTVRKHREHINQKLDVHSPASLAAFAIKASLV
ncbi:MAG: response regulator transcription factor [Parasphingorhabdus sp.]